MNLYRRPNLIRIIWLAAFALLSAGCGGGGGIDLGGGNFGPVVLQSIQVQAARTSLETGASVELHAIGHYSDGTVADVTSIVYPMTS